MSNLNSRLPVIATVALVIGGFCAGAASGKYEDALPTPAKSEAPSVLRALRVFTNGYIHREPRKVCSSLTDRLKRLVVRHEQPRGRRGRATCVRAVQENLRNVEPGGLA